MRLAAILAVCWSFVCLWSYQAFGLRMLPDFDLYTQGGLGLYPSPLGRAFGYWGADVFAALSAAAAGGVILLAGVVARARGVRSSGAAAALLLLSPAALYLAYAGIDPLGLVLLMLALSGMAPAVLFAAAAMTHLSLVPYGVLLLRGANWAVRAAFVLVAALTVASLLLTPYSGVIYGWFHPDALAAFGFGLLAGLVLSLPALLVARPTGTWLVALLIGAAECGLQHHLQARYMLPAAVLAVLGAERSWVGSVRRSLHAFGVTLPRNAERSPVTVTAPNSLDAIGPRRELHEA